MVSNYSAADLWSIFCILAGASQQNPMPNANNMYGTVIKYSPQNCLHGLPFATPEAPAEIRISCSAVPESGQDKGIGALS